jgi:hypothetical protein
MLHGTGEVSASYHAVPRLTLVLITPHDHFDDSSITHVAPPVVACRSVTHLATVRTVILTLGLAEQTVRRSVRDVFRSLYLFSIHLGSDTGARI